MAEKCMGFTILHRLRGDNFKEDTQLLSQSLTHWWAIHHIINAHFSVVYLCNLWIDCFFRLDCGHKQLSRFINLHLPQSHWEKEGEIGGKRNGKVAAGKTCYGEIGLIKPFFGTEQPETCTACKAGDTDAQLRKHRSCITVVQVGMRNSFT